MQQSNLQMPLAPLNAQGRAYHYLRGEIASGRIRGGDVVDPNPIAIALGLSRVPVREAMVRLATEGFLTSRQNRSMIVTELGAFEIQELYDIRAELEALAARRAVPNLTESKLDTLRFLARRMQEASRSPEVWGQLHSEFHCEISRLSGYPILHAQIMGLHARLQPYLRFYHTAYSRMESDIGNHVELIDVLQTRNIPEIEAKMREHIWKAGRETSDFAKLIGKERPSEAISA
jgi:DNA-binding GntR family transcriptional regulator